MECKGERSLLISEKATPRLSRIEAITIGSTAAKLLSKKGIIGQVFGIFDRSVNVSFNDENILIIARKGVSNSPITVILDIPSDIRMTEYDIMTGENVTSLGSSIQIENSKMVINLDKALLWNPQRLIKTDLANSDIMKNCDTARDMGIRYGKHGGLAELLESFDTLIADKPSDTVGHNIYAVNALPHIKSLVGSALSGNFCAVGTTAGRLIGLGPGLTPSCDDMLIGFMSSLVLAAPALGGDVEYARKINNAIVSYANSQTTLLSRKLLEHAAEGETVELIHNLVESILTGTGEHVREITLNLLAVGHSSGTDALLGLLLGFHVATNITKERGLVIYSAGVGN